MLQMSFVDFAFDHLVPTAHKTCRYQATGLVEFAQCVNSVTQRPPRHPVDILGHLHILARSGLGRQRTQKNNLKLLKQQCFLNAMDYFFVWFTNRFAMPTYFHTDNAHVCVLFFSLIRAPCIHTRHWCFRFQRFQGFRVLGQASLLLREHYVS